jgi:hypothetical protein
MPTVYGALDLVKNELRNAAVQNLGTAPASPVKGQLYYDSTGNVLYWWDGTTWQSAKASAGTVSYGNVVAEPTFGSASANGAQTTVSRSDHAHGNPVHDAAAHSTISLSALAAPTADLNLNFHKITNVNYPTTDTDAASKNYVDNMVQGLDAKASCRVATTANITLSGTQTIDGIAVVANDRVLVKNQTTGAQNGIYTVAAGAWARAFDMDAWAEVPAAYTWIELGTTQADTGWLCTNDAGGTLDTTAMTWVQFSGASQITAGAGLTKTGNSLDVVAGDTSLTVAADSVIVNTAVIATVASLASYTKKFAAALTGTASPETVTHNLNTRDVAVTVLNGATPYTAVEVDWDAATVNTVTIRYNPNLGAGYRCVVVG